MDGPNIPMEIINFSVCHLIVPPEHHVASLATLAKLGEGDISQCTNVWPLLYAVDTAIALYLTKHPCPLTISHRIPIKISLSGQSQQN